MNIDKELDSTEFDDASSDLDSLDTRYEIEGGSSDLSAEGKHAKPPQPAYIRKSRRMRKILIAIIILLIALLIAGGVVGYQLLQTANNAASQQTLIQTDVDSINEEDAAKDVSTTTVRKTTIPDLTQLLGVTLEEAIEILQHGAQITSSVEVNEEGNPIKQEVRVALTSEPSDTRSGTPTIYLSLDETGAIIQSGYSVATSSLGYGSLSFADAIQNEHIIENTLAEAGLVVADGEVVLPADKTLYSTYASDGATLVKENYSFKGYGTIEGTDAVIPWNAILSYDYSTANATGNLADTIRTIYVYVSTVVLEDDEVDTAL